MAWLIAYGSIPIGKFICHSCDVKDCVNPGHLFLGSHQENMADSSKKGRTNQGENNPHVKLTVRQVKAIRVCETKGETQHSIAGRFGISQTQVHKICRRKKWTHVK